jgi:hypothetical protein
MDNIQNSSDVTDQPTAQNIEKAEGFPLPRETRTFSPQTAISQRSVPFIF